MFIEYHFTDSCFVKISLKDETRFDSPNYIWITLSEDLKKYINYLTTDVMLSIFLPDEV